MRAMWSETVLFRPGYPVRTGTQPFEPRTTKGGIETRLPPWKAEDGTAVAARILPLRPIPVGFALNSILYGGVIWLVSSIIPRREGRSEKEQAAIDAAVERFQADNDSKRSEAA